MREIVRAQHDAGLPRELFDGFAAAYAALAGTELARATPESVGGVELEDVLTAAGAARAAGEGSPRTG